MSGHGWLRLTILFTLLLVLSPKLAAQTTALPVDLDALPPCNFTEIAGLRDVRVGAVVVNFRTGDGCAENIDQLFQVASVPKIFVAGAYFDLVMRGLASETSELIFNENYYMGGSTACMREENLGQRYTTRQLVELMINCSDNAATGMIMDAIGWGRVQEYIDSVGLEGVGRVIPYSEVDWLRLSAVDPRWEAVPRAMASRYLRMRSTAGLIPTYFPEAPQWDRQAYLRASAEYLASATTNTATPRAIAEYILRLRNDLNSFDTGALVAQRMFTTLLYTQRLNSTQAFPGTILVGAKNGFDIGLTAEVNILFDEINSREPSGLAIVFTQQNDMLSPDVQMPNRENGVLNTYLRRLSSQIWSILYPDYQDPPLLDNGIVSLAVFGTGEDINPCWIPYRRSGLDTDLLPELQRCWATLANRTRYVVGESVYLGLILRGLNSGGDTRVVMVFRGPSGETFSYQTDRQYQSEAAINWFHPLNAAGEWQIDIYVNFEHVVTQFLRVG